MEHELESTPGILPVCIDSFYTIGRPCIRQSAERFANSFGNQGYAYFSVFLGRKLDESVFEIVLETLMEYRIRRLVIALPEEKEGRYVEKLLRMRDLSQIKFEIMLYLVTSEGEKK